MVGLLAAIGSRVTALLNFVGQTVCLLLQAVSYLIRTRLKLGLTINQMSEVGVNSLPIALITVLFSGMVFCYYVVQQAVRYGGMQYVGWVLAEAVFRELGPVLAAIVVAARAGSAMTAELGTMTVTEQVDALRTLAVDPVHYLVVPRLVAAALMLPIVTLFADLAGIGGGYLVILLEARGAGGMDPSMYLSSISANVNLWIPSAGLLKTLFFGMTIAIMACHYGLRCEKGAEGVGQAVMRCVVVCIVCIYISNYFLTNILYPF
ncbi:MAG: MlaE family ABC transporter permease [Armatimonadota bacterium]